MVGMSRGREEQGGTANGCKVLFGADENVVEFDSGDGCIAA